MDKRNNIDPILLTHAASFLRDSQFSLFIYLIIVKVIISNDWLCFWLSLVNIISYWDLS